mmetsp:Transcript_112875/g.324402  ORF Transcript_112875/g.324402 Transcript_112875/m.324402 type:complete len:127 (+) Transcript_112875:95-475(+)
MLKMVKVGNTVRSTPGVPSRGRRYFIQFDEDSAGSQEELAAEADQNPTVKRKAASEVPPQSPSASCLRSPSPSFRSSSSSTPSSTPKSVRFCLLGLDTEGAIADEGEVLQVRVSCRSHADDHDTAA